MPRANPTEATHHCHTLRESTTRMGGGQVGGREAHLHCLVKAVQSFGQLHNHVPMYIRLHHCRDLTGILGKRRETPGQSPFDQGGHASDSKGTGNNCLKSIALSVVHAQAVRCLHELRERSDALIALLPHHARSKLHARRLVWPIGVAHIRKEERPKIVPKTSVPVVVRQHGPHTPPSIPTPPYERSISRRLTSHDRFRRTIPRNRPPQWRQAPRPVLSDGS